MYNMIRTMHATFRDIAWDRPRVLDGSGKLHEAMPLSVIALTFFRQRIPSWRAAPSLSETQLLLVPLSASWWMHAACMLFHSVADSRFHLDAAIHLRSIREF